jgi:hypothetical protein
VGVPIKKPAAGRDNRQNKLATALLENKLCRY